MAQAVAPCGTVSAYKRHRRRGEPACEECKRAKRAYERDRASRARARVTETTGEAIELPEDTPDPHDEPGPGAQAGPTGAPPPPPPPDPPEVCDPEVLEPEGDIEIPDALRDLIAARAILWQSIRIAAATEPTRVNGLIRELRAVLADIATATKTDEAEEEDPLDVFLDNDDGNVVRFSAAQA